MAIASSGMLRLMALARTDVSEEYSASIIGAKRIGELGTLAVTINRRKLRRYTRNNRRFGGTSVLTRATRRNVSEDGILHIGRIVLQKLQNKAVSSPNKLQY
jgi:hypothetical protein